MWLDTPASKAITLWGPPGWSVDMASGTRVRLEFIQAAVSDFISGFLRPHSKLNVKPDT